MASWLTYFDSLPRSCDEVLGPAAGERTGKIGTLQALRRLVGVVPPFHVRPLANYVPGDRGGH